MEMLQDGCAAAEEESTSALNPAPKKRSIFGVEVARWEVARKARRGHGSPGTRTRIVPAHWGGVMWLGEATRGRGGWLKKWLKKW
jgi:hypothetical protein